VVLIGDRVGKETPTFKARWEFRPVWSILLTTLESFLSGGYWLSQIMTDSWDLLASFLVGVIKVHN
jgi:hypothetical protein